MHRVSVICVLLLLDLVVSYVPHWGKWRIRKLSCDLQALIADSPRGLSWSQADLAIASKLNVLSFGMPRVLAPTKARPEWLLWMQVRDDSINQEVIDVSTGRIIFATSTDGIRNWQLHPNSPVLNPSKVNGDWFYFDSEHVGLGDVVYPGLEAQRRLLTGANVYIMYTFGGNAERSFLPGPDQKNVQLMGAKMEIGVAVSQDGAHWSRLEGPSAYGSVLEVSENDKDFDSTFVGWPSVIETGSEYRMYYQSLDASTGKYAIGMAVATDGLLRWVKQGKVLEGGQNEDSFDYKGASRRHVVQLRSGLFYMYYEGTSVDNEHSIGLATSADGRNWVTKGQVFSKNKEDTHAWDGGGVGSPHLVWIPEMNRWRMYYMGYNKESGHGCGMGVAISTDETGVCFVRLND
ncbi:hypothetical protein EON65_00195 [archaeon]|nr:MAG: hypothetical protein EON65_00195 [archaeon]